MAQALEKRFENHRIVFWFDAKKEMRQAYEALEFSDIEKIELNNNEFRVKHRILREEPDKKFLLYHEGEAPSDLDNWLLDVQLASDEFRTDQSAIWLNELGLGIEFTDIVNAHTVFFNVAKRRENLKKLLSTDDTQKKVFVIISDALRYEIGHELHSRIRQEDRFDAEITPMLSTLPSFTQLGMASLLPNKEILFSDDHSTTVFVDGKSTQGTENRSKILQDAVNGAAKAMRADEIISTFRDNNYDST